MPQSSLEKIVQEEVPILRKGYSYLRSAILGLALSVSLHAQLTFNQTASTTLVDQKVIGTAIKNDGFVDNIYVAADGNVQKYDTSFNTVGSSFPDFSGIQSYMNSGIGNTLSFSTLGTGLRDMDTVGTPSGMGYGSSTAFSVSKQVVSGGNTYQLWFDTNLNGVSLYNKTTDSATFLFSSLDLGTNTNWLVDFAEVDTTDIMNSNFIAARQDGFIEEVNLTNGLTGNNGTLSLAGLSSNEAIAGLSVSGNKLSYVIYNTDFNASFANYGGFAGYSEVGGIVPESSTYGATFMGLTALIFALRKRKGVRDLVSKIKNYRIVLVNNSSVEKFGTNGSVSSNDVTSLVVRYNLMPNNIVPVQQPNATYLENSRDVKTYLPHANKIAEVLPRVKASSKSHLIATLE